MTFQNPIPSFHATSANALLDALTTYSEQLEPEMTADLKRWLQDNGSDFEVKCNDLRLQEILGNLPAADALRQWLVQYLTAIIAYLARSEEPCGGWIKNDLTHYRLLVRPFELAEMLNQCLNTALPASPQNIMNAAQKTMADWLPLDLLTADKLYGPLVEELKSTIAVERNALTIDLECLINEPVLKDEAALHEVAQLRLYRQLNKQCDEIQQTIDASAAEHYYALVRYFFSKYAYFYDNASASKAFKEFKQHRAQTQPKLELITDSYINDLLKSAYIPWQPPQRTLMLCPHTNIPMDKLNNRWQSPNTDPVTQRSLDDGDLLPVVDSHYDGRATILRLHPQLLRYWYLPGQLELTVADMAIKHGWHVDFWPKRDEIDLLLTHPKQPLSLAIDAKDHRNARLLGRTFDGFKSFNVPDKYQGFIVVPDYRWTPAYKADYRAGANSSGCSAEIMPLAEFAQMLQSLANTGRLQP